MGLLLITAQRECVSLFLIIKKKKKKKEGGGGREKAHILLNALWFGSTVPLSCGSYLNTNEHRGLAPLVL